MKAILIGIETDYGDGSTVWTVLEIVYLVIFIGELALNVYGFGRVYLQEMIVVDDDDGCCC